MNYPPYRIETERLVLRCWNPEDAPLLKATVDANIDHLKPFLPWARFEPTELQAKVDLMRFFRSQFDTGKEFVYGIFNKEGSLVLGGCGLHRRAGPECLEIGYWLGQDAEGMGLAREAARALTTAAFGVKGIDRVEVHHDTLNPRSGRVPEALGFTREVVRRRTLTTPAGEFRDEVVWLMYKDEWNDANPKETT